MVSRQDGEKPIWIKTKDHDRSLLRGKVASGAQKKAEDKELKQFCGT